MFQRELEAALHAAGTAGKYLRDEYQRFQVIPNAPADITTECDHRAQEIILQELTAAFPDDAFCAEEETATMAKVPHTGERLWIIDPIDGTRGFAQKNGEFSVMIGFVTQGQIGVGVVLQPATERLTYAVRDGGCWRRDGDSEPVRCRVSSISDPAQATLTQSRSRNPGKPSRTVQAISPGRVLESYSAGIKLALVARADADLYLNTYDAFHDWDICAGHLLVSEAGGKVTGLGGQELVYGLPGAWQRHGLLGTNGSLHDEAVKRLAALRSEI
jgi:3'(2'), 5'-bisphosphate nucleotidase